MNTKINELLVEAASNNSIGVVEYLLEKGADNKDTALYSACVNGHSRVCKILIEHGAYVTVDHFEEAAYSGNVDLIHDLIHKLWRQGSSKQLQDKLTDIIDNCIVRHELDMARELLKIGELLKWGEL